MPTGDSVPALQPQQRSGAKRVYRVIAMVLLIRPFGNLFLAWGMKHFSQVLSANPFFYLRAMMNPFVAMGILLLALTLLMRMALLSVADLSYVLPLSGGGMLLSALLGKVFLREQISIAGWIGALLIFLGTLVVGPTSVKTTGSAEGGTK